MPTKRCCCGSRNCLLGEDDFNRADSTNVGSKWSEVSGGWEIQSNQLVCTSAGILATTICHPSWATRGSFKASFKIVNFADAKVYRFRAGDPNGSTYEGQFTLTDRGGGGWRADGELTDGTTTRTITEFNFSDEDTVTVDFCYAPGLSLFLGIRTENFVEGYDASLCIPDGGATCWSGLGNFSFLEGDFDDWYCEIHRVDDLNGICPFCECPCGEGEGAAHTVRCWPDQLTLTLTGSCPNIPDTYTLYQRRETSGATDFSDPLIQPSENLRSWFSDTIDMGDYYFAWKLDCEYAFNALYELTYPVMRLSLIFWVDFGDPFPIYADISDTIGFDDSYPETISAVTEIPAHNRTEAATLSSSTCNPIVLNFPPIKEYHLVFGSAESFCAGPLTSDDPDGEQFFYEFTPTVTE